MKKAPVVLVSPIPTPPFVSGPLAYNVFATCLAVPGSSRGTNNICTLYKSPSFGSFSGSPGPTGFLPYSPPAPLSISTNIW